MARLALLFALGCLLLLTIPTNTHAQQCAGPITKQALLRVLRKGVHRVHKEDLRVLISEVRKCKVDFSLSSENENEQELRSAAGKDFGKGLDVLIAAIRAQTIQTGLRLSFSGPKNAAWEISNDSSSAIARDVRFWFILIDLDQPNPDGLGPPYFGPVQALRIPPEKIDFINPGHSAGGGVLSLDLLRKVNIGDRLFGTADIACPGCEDQSYWVYIEQGKGGWYAKMHGRTSRGLTLPIGAILMDANTELEKLVPLPTRIPIE